MTQHTETCPDCKGTGKEEDPHKVCNGQGCVLCNRKGYLVCSRCLGTGKIPKK